MQLLKYGQLLVFLLISTIGLSQNDINLVVGDSPAEANKFLVVKETTQLENGNTIVYKGEGIVNIFKQNEYPQELHIISPDNEVTALRSIKDTIIFTTKVIADKPQIFYTDLTGVLKTVALDPATLSNQGDHTTLLQLSTRKDAPKKINDFVFPEIIQSPDQSKMGIIQSRFLNGQLVFEISIVDNSFNLIYKKQVRTSHKYYTDFSLKSVLLSNNGQVYLSGTSDKGILTIYEINESNDLKYQSAALVPKTRACYSELQLSDNDELHIYRLLSSQKNEIQKLDYIQFDDQLKITASQSSDIGMNYELNKVGIRQTRLFFKSIKTLPGGDIFITAEYAMPPPDATLLGTMLIQRLESAHTPNGPIVAVRLNADQTVKASKLIIKKNQLAKYLGDGHHLIIKDDIAHFLMNERKGRKNDNLLEVQLHLNDNTISERVLFNAERLGKGKVVLQNGIDLDNGEVILFGAGGKRAKFRVH